MEKTDLRIIKTRRALGTAMFTLLRKQDFASITVNDICAEAMVSRTTFYVHFQDKYDLLRFCMELMQQQLFDKTRAMTLRERVKDVLERIKENVKVFKNLVMENVDQELHAMFERAFYQEVSQGMDPELEAKLPGPPEIVLTFYATGIASCIIRWVDRDMPYSTDEMADCLCQLMPLPALKSDCCD